MPTQGSLLYIITRKDLPIGDQAVQACHAVELWKYESGDQEEVHTMALLVVDDEKALEMLARNIKYRMIECSKFREPDLNDELTAIACLTDKKQLFKGLRKLGEA